MEENETLFELWKYKVVVVEGVADGLVGYLDLFVNVFVSLFEVEVEQFEHLIYFT